MGRRDLIWFAMAEADTYRRYYHRLLNRLRRQNRWCLVLAGLTSVAATVCGVLGYTARGGIVLVIGVAFTMARDVLNLPNRISEVGAAWEGLNREYDALRMRWLTGGAVTPPPPEETSFDRVSLLCNLGSEPVNEGLLDKARLESEEYHENVESPDNEAFT